MEIIKKVDAKIREEQREEVSKLGGKRVITIGPAEDLGGLVTGTLAFFGRRMSGFHDCGYKCAISVLQAGVHGRLPSAEAIVEI